MHRSDCIYNCCDRRVPIEQPAAAKSTGAQNKLANQFTDGRIVAAVNVAANLKAQHPPYPIYLEEHLVRVATFASSVPFACLICGCLIRCLICDHACRKFGSPASSRRKFHTLSCQRPAPTTCQSSRTGRSTSRTCHLAFPLTAMGLPFRRFGRACLGEPTCPS